MNTLNELCRLAVFCQSILKNNQSLTLDLDSQGTDLVTAERDSHQGRLKTAIKIAQLVLKIAGVQETPLAPSFGGSTTTQPSPITEKNAIRDCYQSPEYAERTAQFAFAIRSTLVNQIDVSVVPGIDIPTHGLLQLASRILSECGLVSRNSSISLKLQQKPQDPEHLNNLQSFAEDQLCFQHIRRKALEDLQPLYYLLFLEKSFREQAVHLFDLTVYDNLMVESMTSSLIPLQLKETYAQYRKLTQRLQKATRDWISGIECPIELLQQLYVEEANCFCSRAPESVTKATVSAILNVHYLQARIFCLYQNFSKNYSISLDDHQNSITALFTTTCPHTRAQSTQLYSHISYLYSLFYRDLHFNNLTKTEMESILGWVNAFISNYPLEKPPTIKKTQSAQKHFSIHEELCSRANYARLLAIRHFNLSAMQASIAAMTKQKVETIYEMAFKIVQKDIRTAFLHPNLLKKVHQHLQRLFDFPPQHYSFIKNIIFVREVLPTSTLTLPPELVQDDDLLADKIESLHLVEHEPSTTTTTTITTSDPILKDKDDKTPDQQEWKPIIYQQRVLRFLHLGMEIFNVSPEYKKIEPSQQVEVLYRHAFPHEVDATIPTHFIKLNWRNHQGKYTLYTCPGTLEINNKLLEVVVEYCIDAQGSCYHRHIANKTNARSHQMTLQRFYAKEALYTPDDVLGIWQTAKDKAVQIQETLHHTAFISQEFFGKKIILCLYKKC